MSRYRDQVTAALRAVTIRGPTRYIWLGRNSKSLPASMELELDEHQRRRYLTACLREELYCSFYCHGMPVPARWGQPEPASADPQLTAALSEANTGRGSWQPGWRVARLDGDVAVAVRSRLRVRLPIQDCRADRGTVGPGATVSIRLPKELPRWSPGFLTFVGDYPADPASYATVARVYWNIGRTGAPTLVRALTSRLNAAGVPFRLKVADHPFRLDRCDAAVLYLPGDVFGALAETLRATVAEVSGLLRPQIPAFTLQFASGVGLAEGDTNGESFGVSRCRLLAEGIVRAHAHGIASVGAQLEAVAARFAEDGVRIDAPYLEPSLAGRHVL